VCVCVEVCKITCKIIINNTTLFNEYEKNSFFIFFCIVEMGCAGSSKPTNVLPSLPCKVEHTQQTQQQTQQQVQDRERSHALSLRDVQHPIVMRSSDQRSDVQHNATAMRPSDQNVQPMEQEEDTKEKEYKAFHKNFHDKQKLFVDMQWQLVVQKQKECFAQIDARQNFRDSLKVLYSELTKYKCHYDHFTDTILARNEQQQRHDNCVESIKSKILNFIKTNSSCIFKLVYGFGSASFRFMIKLFVENVDNMSILWQSVQYHVDHMIRPSDQRSDIQYHVDHMIRPPERSPALRQAVADHNVDAQGFSAIMYFLQTYTDNDMSCQGVETLCSILLQERFWSEKKEELCNLEHIELDMFLTPFEIVNRWFASLSKHPSMTNDFLRVRVQVIHKTCEQLEMFLQKGNKRLALDIFKPKTDQDKLCFFFSHALTTRNLLKQCMQMVCAGEYASSQITLQRQLECDLNFLTSVFTRIYETTMQKFDKFGIRREEAMHVMLWFANVLKSTEQNKDNVLARIICTEHRLMDPPDENPMNRRGNSTLGRQAMLIHAQMIRQQAIPCHLNNDEQQLEQLHASLENMMINQKNIEQNLEKDDDNVIPII